MATANENAPPTIESLAREPIGNKSVQRVKEILSARVEMAKYHTEKNDLKTAKEYLLTITNLASVSDPLLTPIVSFACERLGVQLMLMTKPKMKDFVKNVKKSLQWFQRAIALNPKRIYSYFAIGWCYAILDTTNVVRYEEMFNIVVDSRPTGDIPTDKGMAEAKYALATVYNKGEIVAKDRLLAEKLYLEAKQLYQLFSMVDSRYVTMVRLIDKQLGQPSKTS